jgi:hypothetical protein
MTGVGSVAIVASSARASNHGARAGRRQAGRKEAGRMEAGRKEAGRRQAITSRAVCVELLPKPNKLHKCKGLSLGARIRGSVSDIVAYDLACGARY